MYGTDEKKIGIYKITSPTGKTYVGQSTNIEKRKKTYQSRPPESQIKIFRSIIKYGFDAHIFSIIEECDEKDLNEKERFYQDLFDATGLNGLNCKLTGTDDKKGKMSDETKQKISDANKGKSRNKGQKLSDETKLKISKAKKGRKQTIETVNKRMAAQKGKKRSAEFCKSVSERMKKFQLSDESKKKISETLKRKYSSGEIKSSKGSKRVKL